MWSRSTTIVSLYILVTTSGVSRLVAIVAALWCSDMICLIRVTEDGYPEESRVSSEESRVS